MDFSYSDGDIRLKPAATIFAISSGDVAVPMPPFQRAVLREQLAIGLEVAFVERAAVVDEKRADRLDVLELLQPRLDRVGAARGAHEVTEPERQNEQQRREYDALLKFHDRSP